MYSAAIGNYNKHVGGVDLLDPFLNYYRIHVHSKNWYHRLLWHYFDLSLVQEWLLHKRLLEDEAMSLKNFKISVANALILCGKVKWKRGRPSLTQLESFFRKKRERDLQHYFHIHQLDWVMSITGLNLPVKMEGVNCQGIRVFRNFFAQNIKCIFAWLLNQTVSRSTINTETVMQNSHFVKTDAQNLLCYKKTSCILP